MFWLLHNDTHQKDYSTRPFDFWPSGKHLQENLFTIAGWIECFKNSSSLSYFHLKLQNWLFIRKTSPQSMSMAPCSGTFVAWYTHFSPSTFSVSFYCCQIIDLDLLAELRVLKIKTEWPLAKQKVYVIAWKKWVNLLLIINNAIIHIWSPVQFRSLDYKGKGWYFGGYTY